MKLNLNTQTQNSPNYKAVNQQYLKLAQDEHKIMNTVSGDLIELLQRDILMKKIPPQDGIDTVEAIKEYTKPKYHKFLEPIIEMCTNISKRTAKK